MVYSNDTLKANSLTYTAAILQLLQNGDTLRIYSKTLKNYIDTAQWVLLDKICWVCSGCVSNSLFNNRFKFSVDIFNGASSLQYSIPYQKFDDSDVCTTSFASLPTNNILTTGVTSLQFVSRKYVYLSQWTQYETDVMMSMSSIKLYVHAICKESTRSAPAFQLRLNTNGLKIPFSQHTDTHTRHHNSFHSFDAHPGTATLPNAILFCLAA